ncbi:MAG: alanine--tRNA ligase [Candidatus Uhrbacteria bacterium]
MEWTAELVRETYLNFFKQRGHIIIPSASLIPENDPSVLFTTAGMHPLVPYLLGQEHPSGKRLTDVQKCIRTGDIDEVGDATHLTFFEMLGNWSLGDYWKEEAIPWSWELLTGKDGFGIHPNRIAVTVFAGDNDALRDEESAELWKRAGVSEKRIAYLDKEENWWPAGGKHPGPQGPDTEMFVWTGDGDPPELFDPSDENWVEVWNDVFMTYNRTEDGVYEPLKQRNVDTGMGDRILIVLEGKKHVYETDLFRPIVLKIAELSGRDFIGASEDRRVRIVADHLRAATFILGDPFGIAPSNVDQGYVLRKLIRRAVRAGKSLGISCTEPWTPYIAEAIIEHYCSAYPELKNNCERIIFELTEEERKFYEVLERGTKHFDRLVKQLPEGSSVISGTDVFTLYESYGFPLEMTEDLAREHEPSLTVDRVAYAEAERTHQEQSRATAGQRFTGGLADHSDQAVRYHTATHLLHVALRSVLGDHIEQKGSNITPDRMRFDFTHAEKVTREQLAEVERIVREQIAADLTVSYELMSVEDAKRSGVIGLFDDRYAQLGEQIKVYRIGEGHDMVSAEICGGPHVGRTGMIGNFHIAKEEAVGRGVRRIRAIIDPSQGVAMEIAQAASHG